MNDLGNASNNFSGRFHDGRRPTFRRVDDAPFALFVKAFMLQAYDTGSKDPKNEPGEKFPFERSEIIAISPNVCDYLIDDAASAGFRQVRDRAEGEGEMDNGNRDVCETEHDADTCACSAKGPPHGESPVHVLGVFVFGNARDVGI